MSRAFVRLGVGAIVRSDLPGSLDADDVRAELLGVVESALDEWFKSGRGLELLSRKPEVV